MDFYYKRNNWLDWEEDFQRSIEEISTNLEGMQSPEEKLIFLNEFRTNRIAYIRRHCDPGEWNMYISDDDVLQFIYDKISEIKRISKDLSDLSPTAAKSTNHEQQFKLSDKRKTDLIRILDAMYALKMIKTPSGLYPTKKDWMIAVGQLVGEDFSDYDTSLSQAIKVGSTEANLKIFEDLKERFEEKLRKK